MAGKINFERLAEGLDKVLEVVQQLAPIAQAIGGPAVANVATIAIAGAAIAENVLERAREAKGVIAERDQERLRAILQELAAINDKLASEIAAS